LGRILTGSGHPALTTCNISFFYQPSLWGQINVRYVTIRRCYVLDKEEVWCDGGRAAWKVRNCPILLLLSRSLDIVSCGECPVSDDDMDNTWDKAQCQCQHYTNDMLSPCWLPHVPHQVAIVTIYWLLLTFSSMISTLSLKCVKDSGLKMWAWSSTASY
jgi:hypothetical protein